ncbi:MAG: TIGR04141 family sporadically distributed protein [Xanthobacteraceae bacterium]|nr:TIGR04141 family sporadically distributed protein [Xanthobacteraceae bacterium]MCW5675275.1 TIGR04141 family sporadically distributed protein [Xanthobacteraceae bacterium]
MAKSISLSIRLISEDAKTENSILKTGLGLRSVGIKGKAGSKIFFQATATKTPKWLPRVNAIAEKPVANLFNAQASALLLLKVDKRYFAVSFGSGWAWLEGSAVERRFGLLAALNCIGEEQIKVVDAQQIDTLALSKRSQVSHSSEIAAFGLDASRDLMQAVMGKPKDSSIGSSITGADALRLVAKLDLSDIDKKCSELLKLSKSKEYQKRYSWIDNIEQVKNPDQKEKLDQLLVKSINEKETDRLFLSPPRIRDIMTDEEYRLPFGDKDDEPDYDLEIEKLLPRLYAKPPIKIDLLKKNHIDVFINDSPAGRFSIYSALVFEVKSGSSLFCLIDGTWFKVASSHVEEVNKKIDAIKVSNIDLPKAKKGEKEKEYNTRASQEKNLLFLDEKLIVYGGGQSRIEICDLMSDKPEYVHVKKSGGSQVLSHLFNQGVVSGQSLMDLPFRKLCKQYVTGKYWPHLEDGKFSANKSTVVFALIMSKPKNIPTGLPFFSKQTLANANDQLSRFGYKVEIIGIGVE